MILALLLSCADTSFYLHSEFCQDWTPGSEPELQVTLTELGFDVTRVGVEKACDSIFSADITVDGKEIRITEVWDYGDDDGCDVCFAPSVQVEDPPNGTLTIRWFDDSGAASAVHATEVDPDA
jgi:hypothetical protein